MLLEVVFYGVWCTLLVHEMLFSQRVVLTGGIGRHLARSLICAKMSDRPKLLHRLLREVPHLLVTSLARNKHSKHIWSYSSKQQLLFNLS
jgi:hypothetical protein